MRSTLLSLTVLALAHSWMPWHETTTAVSARSIASTHVVRGVIGVSANDGDHLWVFVPNTASITQVTVSSLEPTESAEVPLQRLQRADFAGSAYAYDLVIQPDPRDARWLDVSARFQNSSAKPMLAVLSVYFTLPSSDAFQAGAYVVLAAAAPGQSPGLRGFSCCDKGVDFDFGLGTAATFPRKTVALLYDPRALSVHTHSFAGRNYRGAGSGPIDTTAAWREHTQPGTPPLFDAFVALGRRDELAGVGKRLIAADFQNENSQMERFGRLIVTWKATAPRR